MNRLKQNYQRAKLGGSKLSNKQVRKLLTFSVVMVATGGLIWLTHTIKTAPKEVAVDCKALSSSGRSLLSKDQKQAAYDQLKAAADKCAVASGEIAKDPTKIQDYVAVVEYNGDLAAAAFAAGDKAQAKAIAEQGIKLNEARTPEQSSKIPPDQIPTLNAALIKMYDIKEGYYQHTPEQFSDGGETQ